MARAMVDGERGSIEILYNKQTRLLAFSALHDQNWIDPVPESEDCAFVENLLDIKGIPLGDLLRVLDIDEKAVVRALKDPSTRRVSQA